MIWPFANQFALPPSPIPSDFRRGTLIYASGKGVDRCWQSDRQVIGTWSHGFRRQAVEDVIWLSPRLLSRWTGFLAAKEKWPPDEQKVRWERLSGLVGNRCIFVVRLSAFPKVSVIEDGENRPSFGDLEKVRFQVTIDGSGLPRPPLRYFVGLKEYSSEPGWEVREASVESHPFAILRGHDQGAVEGFEWWQATPLRWVYGSEFEPVPPRSLGSPIGWYRSDWHWVEADVQSMSATVSDFQFRVFSPGKERIANFSIRAR